MAGGQERILRQRLKSVRATRKITKAMELIAASRIPKSQARIVASRPYRTGVSRLVTEVALGDARAAAKLLATPERIERAGVLAVIGDRGLSGPYNSSILRATEFHVTALGARGTAVTLYTVGKKAASYFRFRGIPVAQSFQGFSDQPTYGDAREVAAALVVPFLSDALQQLTVVSMHFKSGATQEVVTRQLLPLVVDPAVPGDPQMTRTGYTEFEPDPERMLAELTPVALESEIFTVLLEGAASFHVSQQRAMAAASENADELSRRLTREMNRARQDSITTEIMEIVGGAEALRTGK